MVRLTIWGFALTVLIEICPEALCQRVVGQESADEQGWVSMFDGQTLEGWSVLPEATRDAWSVKDGIIVGTGPKDRSYLTYAKQDVRDFELKLCYRFIGKGNSGVSIRARVDETGKRGFQCYHADFGHAGIGKNVLGAWDFHTPGRTEHRCFRGDRLVIDENDKASISPISDPLRLEHIHAGNWNGVHLIVREDNFKLYINGRLASEFTEHLPAHRKLDRGMIQLQLHDPGMVVQFQNPRIRILD